MSASPPASSSERFMRPSSSSKMRRFTILSARYSASAGESSWRTPTSTTRPAAMTPTTSSPTVTLASITRCTTARIALLLLLAAADGADDVEDVGEASHGEEQPVEVVHVLHFHADAERGRAVAVGLCAHRGDVGLHLAKDVADVGE